MDVTHCPALNSGQCLMSTDLGATVCNDTDGVIVSGPVAQCNYYVCGYENLTVGGIGPNGREGTVCVLGSNSFGTMRAKPLGLRSTLLMVLCALSTIVRALPTSQPDKALASRRVKGSSFERDDKVDWAGVTYRLRDKTIGTSTTIGRSRYTILSHESKTPPGTIPQGLVGRQVEGIPPYDTVYQENVDRTDTWDDCWQIASNCIQSGFSDAGGSTSIGVSYQKTAAVSVGLDFGVAATFAEVINSNAGLNLGFTWSDSVSYSSTDSCNVNADVEVAQMFWRPIMGWADTASRTCQVSPIYGELYCTDWVFGHIDYPLKQFGGIPARTSSCSAGWEVVHCSEAIGTQKCGNEF